ncbi:hypothetical protein RclHR1_04740014 [Rhizophagus clarus]|uniref:Uncharacterized protein n=1 Tax=Rhizophagus clarus TaxID=94130 RepID=A0A2Z6RKG5_9GLOM|nr:hypothetical protein RclHR1_04740014 [Rhizophagus clarus]
MKVYTISKVQNFNSKRIRFSKHSILKADSIQRKPVFLTSILKSMDGFLEEILKVWNVAKLQRCFPDGIWDSEGPRLSGLQLPNTTGLNFEDLASKHNFEDPRLSKCLIDRISEVCVWTFVAFWMLSEGF